VEADGGLMENGRWKMKDGISDGEFRIAI